MVTKISYRKGIVSQNVKTEKVTYSNVSNSTLLRFGSEGLMQLGQKSSWHSLAPLGARALVAQRALNVGELGDPCDSGL